MTSNNGFEGKYPTIRLRTPDEIEGSCGPNLGEQWFFQVYRWLLTSPLRSFVIASAWLASLGGAGYYVGRREAAAVFVVAGLSAATYFGQRLALPGRQQHRITLQHLRAALPALVTLAALYMLTAHIVALFAEAVGTLLPPGVDPQSEQQAALLTSLASLPLTIPLVMCIWFAPGLSISGGLNAVQAIQLSFLANLRNVKPLMQWGRYYSFVLLSAMVLALVISIVMALPQGVVMVASIILIPAGLALLFVIPMLPLVAIVSSAVMARDLFVYEDPS